METPMQEFFNDYEKALGSSIPESLKEKYLEKEKQVIIESHDKGMRDVFNDFPMDMSLFISKDVFEESEQYYKETFINK